MSISLLLEMAVSANPERIAVVSGDERCTTQQLSDMADGASGVIAESGADHVVYVGVGGGLLPTLMSGAARAARPFTPINYRLSAESITELIERLPNPLVVVDDRYHDSLLPSGVRMTTSEDFLAAAPIPHRPLTSSPIPTPSRWSSSRLAPRPKPKAVELSHTNLTSYVTGTVEFDSADPDDAALYLRPAVSHRRGRRRPCRTCTPVAGQSTCRCLMPGSGCGWRPPRESANATVVPTMLDRIVTELEWEPTEATEVEDPRLRRIEGRIAPGAQGTRTAPPRRVRQRLRPHRDQLDFRGPDSR